jgi:hypothetical protein
LFSYFRKKRKASAPSVYGLLIFALFQKSYHFRGKIIARGFAEAADEHLVAPVGEGN